MRGNLKKGAVKEGFFFFLIVRYLLSYITWYLMFLYNEY